MSFNLDPVSTTGNLSASLVMGMIPEHVAVMLAVLENLDSNQFHLRTTWTSPYATQDACLSCVVQRLRNARPRQVRLDLILLVFRGLPGETLHHKQGCIMSASSWFDG